MQVDGQLKGAQLELQADDSPSPAAPGRVYVDTTDSELNPFIMGLSRWERLLTDNTRYATKTATYTVTRKDEIVMFNAAGGSIIANLPSAASVAGKVLELIRIDSTIANDVTVTPASGAETIDGETTFILKTKLDRIRILSNGTLWLLLSHTYHEGWVTATPAVANWVTNTTATMKYRRKGKCIDAEWNLALTGAPDSANCLLGMPSGFKIDTAAMLMSTQGKSMFPGQVVIFDAAPERYTGFAGINDEDSLYVYVDDGDKTFSIVTQANPITFATGDNVNARVSDIPIVKLR